MTEDSVQEQDRTIGTALGELRRARGLSRRALAKTTDIGPRRLSSIERGRAVPDDDELEALATALGASRADLVRWEPAIALTGAAAGRAGGDPVRGADALDALLREYLSMLRDLRATDETGPETIRHADLRQLADALGGDPDVIETRLVELLGTDRAEASELRAAILGTSAA